MRRANAAEPWSRHVRPRSFRREPHRRAARADRATPVRHPGHARRRRTRREPHPVRARAGRRPARRTARARRARESGLAAGVGRRRSPRRVPRGRRLHLAELVSEQARIAPAGADLELRRRPCARAHRRARRSVVRARRGRPPHAHARGGAAGAMEDRRRAPGLHRHDAAGDRRPADRHHAARRQMQARPEQGRARHPRRGPSAEGARRRRDRQSDAREGRRKPE